MIQTNVTTQSLVSHPLKQLINTNYACNINRYMNRNARRPKKANHGKRAVCNARRKARYNKIRSRAHREKIFGYWY